MISVKAGVKFESVLRCVSRKNIPQKYFSYMKGKNPIGKGEDHPDEADRKLLTGI
jgi:hypothetical protein